jgi:hypothetical protein
MLFDRHLDGSNNCATAPTRIAVIGARLPPRAFGTFAQPVFSFQAGCYAKLCAKEVSTALPAGATAQRRRRRAARLEVRQALQAVQRKLSPPTLVPINRGCGSRRPKASRSAQNGQFGAEMLKMGNYICHVAMRRAPATTARTPPTR